MLYHYGKLLLPAFGMPWSEALTGRAAVRPSVSYENEQKFFGFNYLEWKDDGWPVLASAD